MSEARQKFSVELCREHFDEASFVWSQRRNAVTAGDLRLKGVLDLDERLQAHIDGIRVAGEAVWQACEIELTIETPGDVMISMLLALEGKRQVRIEGLYALAEQAPPLQNGVISAFGWCSRGFLQGIVQELLGSPSPFLRRLGIACCAIHRVEAGATVDIAMRDAFPVLAARALRAAGELGEPDRRSICLERLTDQDESCSVWAAWSAVLLGDRSRALEALLRAGTTPGTHQETAFRLSLQASKPSVAHEALEGLARDAEQMRWLIHGSGIAGDPRYVPWLIGHMANQKTARLAGEAFGLITAADLERSGLDGKQPENSESGPSDDADDPNVDMDPDDGLPWPDVDKVKTWWAANGSRFQTGTRYFMGAPVTREHCIDVLKNGYQRQRILAAHYLCLLEPGTPLFNTSAPAWRQQRLLSQMK